MAMIPCSECGHSISNRAVNCPNCGAPSGAPSGAPNHAPRAADGTLNRPGRFVGGLIGALVIWGVATTAWLVHAHKHDTAGGALSHETQQRSMVAVVQAPNPGAADSTSTPPAAAAQPAVYQTTADQLAQDFNENAVAAQSKISGRKIRVSGVVAEIDEDAQSRAIVKLKTKQSNGADLALNDDQKPGAAQIVKGQNIEIECDTIRHSSGYPQGSGCVLVQHATDGTAAYLAVAFTTDSAQAPLFIVGPIPMNACLTQTDRITGQLNAKGHALSKTCSAIAQDNIQVGCRLDSMMTSLPDLPQARVWRYNCAKEVASGSKPREIKSARHVLPAAVASTVSTTSSATTAAQAPTVLDNTSTTDKNSTIEQPVPLATPTSAVRVAANATSEPASGEPAPTPLPTPVPPSQTAAPAATVSAPPSAASDVPSDLSAVNTADPKAAIKINSYCNTVTASAANRDAVAAGCRREEVAAWSRFVAQNEYPTLDDATRSKCNEPPFPDSYVAKEACAKYQLRQ